jgi:hypothetical protein
MTHETRVVYHAGARDWFPEQYYAVCSCGWEGESQIVNMDTSHEQAYDAAEAEAAEHAVTAPLPEPPPRQHVVNVIKSL